MLDVFLIRHGETYCNVEGRHTGWLDYSLTERGAAQADRAAGYYKGLSFDRYYCSDIRRTRDTFAHIFGPREDCVYTPLLRELNTAECAGKKYEECERLYGERYRIARKSMNFAAFGGEDLADAAVRAQAFLREMEHLPPTVRRVAAVSHALIIRTMFGVITGFDTMALPMRQDNCHTVVYRLKDDGKWTIKAWNIQDISAETDLFGEDQEER